MKDTYLTKNYSNLIKAMAITLMVLHHCWGFPNWVSESNTKFTFLISDIDPEMLIGQWSKICVSLFAFITGYAVCLNPRYRSFKYRLSKLFSFYLMYWVTLVFILIVGAIAGEPMPDLQQFVLDIVGIQSHGEGINSKFAWYVFFYAEVMLITVPILNHILKGTYLWVKCFLMLLGFGALTRVFWISGLSQYSWTSNFSSWSQLVIVGYMVAQAGIFDRTQLYCTKLIRGGRLLLELIVMIVCLPAHYYINTGMLNLDIVYVPVFIFCAVDIARACKGKIGFLRPAVAVVAANSTNIWFLHSLFFTPNKTFQWIAYAPHFGVLIVAWVMVMCIGMSLILTPVQKWLGKSVSRLF